MQGERTPNLPKESDALLSAAAWFGDQKKTAKFLKDAAAVVKRNEELLATIGKADEIERLHAEAQEHKDLVLSEIEKREGALAEDRKKFNANMRRRTTEFDERMEREKAKAHEANKEAETARNEARDSREAAEAERVQTQKALQQASKERDRVVAIREELEGKLARAKAIEEAAA